jgi:hypothetical protein
MSSDEAITAIRDAGYRDAELGLDPQGVSEPYMDGYRLGALVFEANKEGQSNMEVVKYEGTLEIDHETGTARFIQSGVPLLNITHLTTPVPFGRIIEIVALPALTSYIERR